jgi:hypothetical protein
VKDAAFRVSRFLPQAAAKSFVLSRWSNFYISPPS